METVFTKNKCWVISAWQTKGKHMQANMIMLISCQGLCVRASYVNYTMAFICNVWVLHDYFHLLKSSSWLWNIWKSWHDFLCPQRTKKLFLWVIVTWKKTGLAVNATFQDVYLETSKVPQLFLCGSVLSRCECVSKTALNWFKKCPAQSWS